MYPFGQHLVHWSFDTEFISQLCQVTVDKVYLGSAAPDNIGTHGGCVAGGIASHLLDALPHGLAITPPDVLFRKIEDDQVTAWTEQFGGES